LSKDEHQDQAIQDVLASLDGYQLESDVSEGKVLVSSSDNTDEYLESKITAGDNIAITKSTCGGTETLTISAADQTSPVEQQSDEKVKVNSSDNTSDYLQNKIEAGSNISITTKTCGGSETIVISADDQVSPVQSDGTDEKVKISSSDGTPGYLQDKLSAGSNVTLTTETLGGSETIKIDVQSQNIADAEADIDELQNQVAQHSGSIQTLEEDLSSFVNVAVPAMDGYQEQIDQNLGAIHTLRFDHATDIENIANALDAYAIGGDLTNIDEQVTIIQNSLDGYQDQLNQHSGSISTIQVDLSSFVNVAVPAMDGYQEQLDQHAGAITNIRTDHATDIENITNELDGYQDQLDQHSGSISTIQVDLSGFVNVAVVSMDGYQDQLDQQEGSIQTLREDHSIAVENITNDLDGYVRAEAVQLNLIPDTDNLYHIGSNDYRWADGYFGESGIHLKYDRWFVLNRDQSYVMLDNDAEGITSQVAIDKNFNIYYVDDASPSPRGYKLVRKTYEKQTPLFFTGDGSAVPDDIEGLCVYGDYLYMSSGDALWKVDIYEDDAVNSYSTLIAGTNSGGGPLDQTNGYATGASRINIGRPANIQLDSSDNIYFVPSLSDVVRKYEPPSASNSHLGYVSTICGSWASSGSSGDGGDAGSALLDSPNGLWVDSDDNIYIVDKGNDKIRKITASTNIIDTIYDTSGIGTAKWITGNTAGEIYVSFSGADIYKGKIDGSGSLTSLVDLNDAGSYGNLSTDNRDVIYVTSSPPGANYIYTLGQLDIDNTGYTLGIHKNSNLHDAGSLDGYMYILDGYKESTIVSITSSGDFLFGTDENNPSAVEKITVDGAISLKEQSSTPPDNSLGFGKVYVDQSDGNIYYKYEDSTPVDLLEWKDDYMYKWGAVTADSVARWYGTTGRYVYDSLVTINDDGDLQVGNAGIRLAGTVGVPPSLQNGDQWVDSDGYVYIRSSDDSVKIVDTATSVNQITGAVSTLRTDHSNWVEVATADMDSYQSQITELDNQVDQIIGTVSTLSNSFSGFAEVATADMDGYQSQITELDNQVDQITGTVSTLRTDHSNLAEVVTADMDGYQAQITQNTDDIADINTDLGDIKNTVVDAILTNRNDGEVVVSRNTGNVLITRS
jgi:hypothetical protein